MSQWRDHVVKSSKAAAYQNLKLLPFYVLRFERHVTANPHAKYTYEIATNLKLLEKELEEAAEGKATTTPSDLPAKALVVDLSALLQTPELPDKVQDDPEYNVPGLASELSALFPYAPNPDSGSLAWKLPTLLSFPGLKQGGKYEYLVQWIHQVVRITDVRILLQELETFKLKNAGKNDIHSSVLAKPIYRIDRQLEELVHIATYFSSMVDQTARSVQRIIEESSKETESSVVAIASEEIAKLKVDMKCYIHYFKNIKSFSPQVIGEIDKMCDQLEWDEDDDLMPFREFESMGSGYCKSLDDLEAQIEKTRTLVEKAIETQGHPANDGYVSLAAGWGLQKGKDFLDWYIGFFGR